uniref:EOG090X0AQH n=1 Tax=Daphnia similis TaxID=35528 RepID=A0A4Y7LSP5_9CRUS|nr:EOG090X0AQH [Daphnia similis]SVE72480.1 EOG090X0AQH [Daphnia similis]
MDKADEPIDVIPVTSLDDDQQKIQKGKDKDYDSPQHLVVESAEVANANDAFSPAPQLESSLNESANDSYVQVEGLLKLPQLESTRISMTDADLSKIQSETGDSQNPLNAGFVKPNCDNQSSSKLDSNEISVFAEDSDAGYDQQIESEENVQLTSGIDSNMECLNESINSALESQELIDVDQHAEANGIILPNADHSVIEQLNDSVFSTSGNYEPNQHVEPQENISSLPNGESKVEVLMNCLTAAIVNQEPTNDKTEKNGMQESDADPVMETLNETPVLDNQALLPDEKHTAIKRETAAAERASEEVHLNDETTSSDPEVEQLMKLPETVTQLTSKDGVKVYLVGTAHFSQESQEDVAKTILMTRPRVVVVELCVSRLNILRFDEQTILEEAKNLNMEKVRSTIKQYGAVQGALYLLFLSTSAHLTRQLGMAPGGEFRRAYHEARNVHGCRIHLGDRPIHVTLHRALAALSLWQKAKLVWHLLLNRGPISAEEVERCKQKDLLEEMLEEMTGEFPPLSRVFVQERDLCLAHSMQLAAADAASEARSNGQLNEPPTVVGVVGIGHVAGISRYFEKVSESDVKKVMSIPTQTMASRVFVVSFKLSVLGLVCYGCYKVIPKNFSRFLKVVIVWYSAMEIEVEMRDDYQHEDKKLLYSPVNISGSGVDDVIFEEQFEGCACSGTCVNTNCSCIRGGTPFYYSGCGLANPDIPPNLIYECHVNCQCDFKCSNRLVQKGPHIGLSLMNAGPKGIGLWCKVDLPKGAFVCEYAGEHVHAMDGEKGHQRDSNGSAHQTSVFECGWDSEQSSSQISFDQVQ